MDAIQACGAILCKVDSGIETCVLDWWNPRRSQRMPNCNASPTVPARLSQGLAKRSERLS